MARLTELGPDGEPMAETQDMSGAPGTSQNDQPPPENLLQPDPTVPQPQRPPSTAPKINTITTGPLLAPAKAIGDALAERKKKDASVAYRIKCLDTSINSIN